MAKTFEAKYYGRCQECGERIEPGDEVCYDADDDLVHEDCNPELEEEL